MMPGDGEIRGQTTIDVRPLPQSSGKVMDGGDCGYCSIAGIFGHNTILEAYECLESLMPEEGNWKIRESICAYRMKLFLEAQGIEYVEFRPSFDYYRTGLMRNEWDNHNWFKELKGVIDDGNVLYSSVRYERSVPPPPHTADHDHIVIINGWREVWRAHKTVKGARSLISEIRVSCSSKGERWHEFMDFLYWHGCAGIIIPTKIKPERTVEND